MGERTLKYAHAIREAMSAEMRRDPDVVLFGEDVGAYGGVWGVSRGMRAEFGDRVFDTPISEDLIVGMAVGMAMRGMRPIAELQYADVFEYANAERDRAYGRGSARSGFSRGRVVLHV